jgi:PIN domain nuclease of toxin-antitoxin system
MTPRLLLDTHVLFRWIAESQTLSREQRRVLRDASNNGQAVAISAITLLELAQMAYKGIAQLKVSAASVLEELEANPALRILPLTVEIAREVPSLAVVLRDSADSIIVATARVHGLRLLTSDQRIIDSKLSQVID